MATPDPTHTWNLTYKLVSTVLADVSPGIVELGLEVKELFVLAEIDAHPHPAALADSLCIPKPSITLYLKHLEKEGLVKREIDADDLRRHKLSVTAAGRKIMHKGLARIAEAFGARMQRLSAGQQAELAKLLALMA